MRLELLPVAFMIGAMGVILGMVLSQLMGGGPTEIMDGQIQQSLAVLCIQHGHAPDVVGVYSNDQGYSVECTDWNMGNGTNISKAIVIRQ
jgi:hypothetical protein